MEICIEVDGEIEETLKTISGRTGKSPREIVKRAVAYYLARYKKYLKKHKESHQGYIMVTCGNCGETLLRYALGEANKEKFKGPPTPGRVKKEVGAVCPRCGAPLSDTPKRISFTPVNSSVGQT